MWSHVIAPVVAAVTRTLRLIGWNQFSWDLGAIPPHVDDPISPDGIVAPSGSLTYWIWEDPRDDADIPIPGNLCTVDTVQWLPGLLTRYYYASDPPTNQLYWAGRWDASTHRMAPIWYVNSPAATTLFGNTRTFGGIVSACSTGAGAIYAIVYNVTDFGTSDRTNRGVVELYSGGSTASSVQDASTVGRWRRACFLADATMQASEDFDLYIDFVNPDWGGHLVTLFTHEGETWGVFFGQVNYYDDEYNRIAQRTAWVLAPCAGVAANDANNWTDIHTWLSRYSLPGATTPEPGHGEIVTSLIWPIAHAGYTFIGWNLRWDSDVGSPDDKRVVLALDNTGVLHDSFTLPAASMDGTEHTSGPLVIAGGYLYLITYERSLGSMTVRLWRLGSAPSTWTNVKNETQTYSTWGGREIFSAVATDDGLIHVVPDPDALGATLHPVKEWIYNPATNLWSSVTHGTPGGPYRLETGPRHIFVEGA